jgi:hypothetical protein
MDIDLDLYRHKTRVSSDPLVRLSAVDISPERPERTFEKGTCKTLWKANCRGVGERMNDEL